MNGRIFLLDGDSLRPMDEQPSARAKATSQYLWIEAMSGFRRWRLETHSSPMRIDGPRDL